MYLSERSNSAGCGELLIEIDADIAQKVTESAIHQGLKSAQLPGRFKLLVKNR